MDQLLGRQTGRIFWERCKTDYPTCEDVAPLLPLIEGLSEEQEGPIRRGFGSSTAKGRGLFKFNGIDSKPVLLLELTVRGFPGDGAREAMWEWFDVAREWIVRGFTDLTTDEIQKTVWRRTR